MALLCTGTSQHGVNSGPAKGWVGAHTCAWGPIWRVLRKSRASSTLSTGIRSARFRFGRSCSAASCWCSTASTRWSSTTRRPRLRDTMHVAVSHFGTIFSSSLIGLMIAAMASGPIADRWGRKWPVIVSVFSFSVFSLLTAHVSHLQRTLGAAVCHRAGSGRRDAQCGRARFRVRPAANATDRGVDPVRRNAARRQPGGIRQRGDDPEVGMALDRFTSAAYCRSRFRFC